MCEELHISEFSDIDITQVKAAFTGPGMESCERTFPFFSVRTVSTTSPPHTHIFFLPLCCVVLWDLRPTPLAVKAADYIRDSVDKKRPGVVLFLLSQSSSPSAWDLRGPRASVPCKATVVQALSGLLLPSSRQQTKIKLRGGLAGMLLLSRFSRVPLCANP